MRLTMAAHLSDKNGSSNVVEVVIESVADELLEKLLSSI